MFEEYSLGPFSTASTKPGKTPSEVENWVFNGKIHIGGDWVEWSKIERRLAYPFTQPDHTYYTLFSLRYYFLIFCAILSLQTVTMWIVKWKKSHAFSSMNILEQMIHCVENTNLPYNAEEWDTAKGDALEHRGRMEANRKEGFAVILCNFIWNTLLLYPLCILGT